MKVFRFEILVMGTTVNYGKQYWKRSFLNQNSKLKVFKTTIWFSTINILLDKFQWCWVNNSVKDFSIRSHFDRNLQELILRMINLGSQTIFSSILLAISVPSKTKSTDCSFEKFLPQQKFWFRFFHQNIYGWTWPRSLHSIDFWCNPNINLTKTTSYVFFSQGLSRCFRTFKLLCGCPSLRLVHRQGNLIRRICQEMHICMKRLDKYTGFVSMQPCRFQTSWSQSTIFYLQKINQVQSSSKIVFHCRLYEHL